MPPVQITNRPSRTEIKVHIENMLKRPRMYAQHVETLELLVLDNLWHLTGKPQIHDYQSWSDQEYHNKTNTVWWSVPEIALHKRENGVELMASHLSMWYAIVLEELNEAPEDLKDE